MNITHFMKQELTARVFAAITIVSLILSALPVAFFVANAASVTVRLQVVPNPVGTDANLEYITLSNLGGTTIDLSGWKLVNGVSEQLLSGTLTDSEDQLYCANINFAENGGKNCEAALSFGLINSGGTVSLVNDTAEIVVSVTWGAEGSSESDAGFNNQAIIELPDPVCAPQYDVAGPTNISVTETGESFNSVQDALADCDTNDGDTISLSGDVTTTAQITINRPITLDGNSNTIFSEFTRTSPDNNAAIGILDTTNVTIEDLTIDGVGGTDLHGINAYRSTNVLLDTVTINDPKRTAVVVNGSNVTVFNIITSGSTWHAINVAPGSGVTEPSVLTVNGTSIHSESAPTPHIYTDDTSKNVMVTDTNNQYEIVYEGPNPQNQSINARSLRLKTVPTTPVPVLYDITACKFAANEEVIAGWDMFVTNDPIGDDGISYEVTTGENGCVSQEVDFNEGPFYVVEQARSGWVQSSVFASFGEVVPLGQSEIEMCQFGGLRMIEDVSVNRVSGEISGQVVLDEPDFRCDFYNEEIEPTQCVNLLANGSFEEPVVTDPSLWQKFALVAGWTIEKVTGGATTLELHRGWSGNQAADGFQYVELDGDESTKISQIVSTLAGGEYELSWAFAPRDVAAEQNQLSVLVNGSEVATEGPATAAAGLDLADWTYGNYSFTASGTSTAIAFADAGPSNTFGTFIDDAELCLVREPEPDTCEDEVNVGADTVVSANQLKLKNGNDITDVNRIDPDEVLGAADWVSGTGENFFSLGFGGSIVISFDKFIPDVLGTDLTIYEGTNGTYPEETALIEVSQDGSDWEIAGTASSNNPSRITNIDFSSTGLPWIKFVRVTDTSDPADFTGAGASGPLADGFDLDAVVATEALCDEPDTDPERGQVIVKKVIVGGNGEITPDYFNFFYTSGDFDSDLFPFEEDGENLLTLDAGTYSFTEIKFDGWSATYEGCEDVVVGGESTPTCTITNTKVLQCVPGVNLLSNGSFENPSIENTEGWDIFDSVVDGLAWVVDWINPSEDAPEVPKLELQDGRTASDGEQYAELDSNYTRPGETQIAGDASVKISQTIETIPGQEYEFSFDFSALPRRGLNNNVVQVLIDGTLVDTQKASGIGNTDTEWNTLSYVFTATDSMTEIGLADAGNDDTFGTLVDNASLICSPGPIVAPYCGDGEVNQEWEQCDSESENCTEQCLFANQCQDIALVKVTLNEDAPTSVSFNNTLYLGDSNTIVPSGVWFPFAALADQPAQSVANNRDGLAIQRDQVTGELKLAVVGNESGRQIDYVQGTVELFNATFGDVDRQLVPGYKLESLDPENENSHQDDFIKDSPTLATFDWTVFGSNDAVKVGIISDDITCEEDGGGGDNDIERYRIEGTVWHDRDSDGERLPDVESEENLAGWIVYATNGEDEYSTTTDASGKYYFEVPAGTWTITQEDRGGWAPTFPSPDVHVVTVPEAEVIEATTTLLDSLFNLVIPTAQAATIILDTLSGYDFGNVEVISNNPSSSRSSSGGGSRRSLSEVLPTGLVAGVSTSTPDGQVLGDQVSIIPTGAPDAGQGGTTHTPFTSALLLVLSAVLLAVVSWPRAKHAE